MSDGPAEATASTTRPPEATARPPGTPDVMPVQATETPGAAARALLVQVVRTRSVGRAGAP